MPTKKIAPKKIVKKSSRSSGRSGRSLLGRRLSFNIPTMAVIIAALAIIGIVVVAVSNAATPAGYANPFRTAHLASERIDQGIDFGGSGNIYALGSGKVVHTYDSGWPGGVFIVYQLYGGAAKGKYVYVAEDCTPRVSIGQSVSASTILCYAYGGRDGIETGWAQAPGSGWYALAHVAYHQHGDGWATNYGENFSSLLRSLGAPAGNISQSSGVDHSALPSGWPTWTAALAHASLDGIKIDTANGSSGDFSPGTITVTDSAGTATRTSNPFYFTDLAPASGGTVYTFSAPTSIGRYVLKGLTYENGISSSFNPQTTNFYAGSKLNVRIYPGQAWHMRFIYQLGTSRLDGVKIDTSGVGTYGGSTTGPYSSGTITMTDFAGTVTTSANPFYISYLAPGLGGTDYTFSAPASIGGYTLKGYTYELGEGAFDPQTTNFHAGSSLTLHITPNQVYHMRWIYRPCSLLCG